MKSQQLTPDHQPTPPSYAQSLPRSPKSGSSRMPISSSALGLLEGAPQSCSTSLHPWRVLRGMPRQATSLSRGSCSPMCAAFATSACSCPTRCGARSVRGSMSRRFVSCVGCRSRVSPSSPRDLLHGTDNRPLFHMHELLAHLPHQVPPRCDAVSLAPLSSMPMLLPSRARPERRFRYTAQARPLNSNLVRLANSPAAAGSNLAHKTTIRRPPQRRERFRARSRS